MAPIARRDPVVATIVPAAWGPVHLAVRGERLAAVEVLTTPDAFEADLVRRFRGEVAWLPARDAPPTLRRLAALLAAAFAVDPAPWAAPTIRPRPSRGSRAAVKRGRIELDRLELDIDDRPAFDREVLAAVRSIPAGETRSYGEVARMVGRPGAARAVGGAVARNPITFVIPCHRVIAGDGSLGGYGGGPWGDRELHLDVKAALLAREGVRVPRRSEA